MCDRWQALALTHFGTHMYHHSFLTPRAPPETATTSLHQSRARPQGVDMATQADFDRLSNWALMLNPDADIDRRKCRRSVPMEVLSLGLARTGTLSMQEALKILGHVNTYHYSSIFANVQDADMWNEALRAKYKGRGKPFGRREWDQLLGHCGAITDVPAVCFWRELLERTQMSRLYWWRGTKTSGTSPAASYWTACWIVSGATCFASPIPTGLARSSHAAAFGSKGYSAVLIPDKPKPTRERLTESTMRTSGPQSGRKGCSSTGWGVDGSRFVHFWRRMYPRCHFPIGTTARRWRSRSSTWLARRSGVH